MKKEAFYYLWGAAVAILLMAAMKMPWWCAAIGAASGSLVLQLRCESPRPPRRIPLRYWRNGEEISESEWISHKVTELKERVENERTKKPEKPDVHQDPH